MSSVASFVRNTPVSTLEAYFARTKIGPPSAVDWSATEPEAVRNLLSALQELAADDRDRVVADIERVAAIADEPGRGALYSVTQNRAQLEDLVTPTTARYGCF